MKNQFLEAWSKMTEKLTSWLDAIIINLPNLIIAIIVFIVVIFISKYINRLTLKFLDKGKMQKSMKNVIAKLMAVLTILIGLFLILGILDLSKTLNTLLAGAGVAGLAVGLALQGAMANTYSGIILSYIKFVKLGDWIKSNDYEGEIVDIDLRAVTLKQVDNNLVYIPNKQVVENPIKNYSRTEQSRVILECGVGYESDLEFVKNLAVKAIANHFDSVESEDDVIFLYREFGDSSINFELRYWINSTSGLEVAKSKTEAIMLLKKEFDKNNINIPFPIRTLDIPNLKFGDKELSTVE
ncbi:mechanosensitive ion channel family protein [Aureibaculum sp. 2210JD6-5]|uniref:mechanosensitive ion channel family protein n=1 Tax=Aureibaculum sp. 2210JD6-5 TaxID=3103957 RepID=UPI002AAC84F5|nr:mechanosensitive ion channel family protein [Aureibaculum sp. 2210JD6-5]MDY7396628.1 mechanosensitive ion channel family protein [Aureibaculum sp. 2210JD6-5]